MAGEDNLFLYESTIILRQMAHTILFITITYSVNAYKWFFKISNLQTFSLALKSALLWSK